MSAIALNGSPSPTSKTGTLARVVLDRVGGGTAVDLSELSADALLYRGKDPAVEEVVRLLGEATIVVAATPVYRATYTALLKTIFDLLPQGALAGSVTIPVATGGSAEHHLCVDHGLRPLVASLGGWTTPTGLYAVPSDFDAEGQPTAGLLERVDAAAAEAARIAG